MENSSATRLLLAALPPSLTLPLLRAHIALCPPQPPLLTDLKILLKPDGTSRRIAFVGFKDHDEAERVLAWIEGSWIQGVRGGARISAQWAKEAKDVPPPRKRSRASNTTEDSAALSIVPSFASPSDDASRFAEFMSVMAPKKKRTLESLNEVSSTVIAPLPIPTKILGEDDQVIVGEVSDTLVVDDVAADEEISDMEYMTRRKKRNLSDELEDSVVPEAAALSFKPWTIEELDCGELSGKAAPTSSNDRPLEMAENQQALAIITESSRLFVRNLGFSISEPELRTLFVVFGGIESIHIPIDSSTSSSKGIAYITFTSSQSAIDAFIALDRTSFQGRLLHILPAIVRNSKPDQPLDRTGLRAAKEEERKKVSASSLSWGTLFMNSDAVVSSIADRLRIDKSTILDPSADNAAVRVALAETHVIAETKKYFESEGVDLDCFSKPGPRSSTTILVKNIPYGTSLSSLQALFSPFGISSRLLLPPAGTIAIVEMSDEVSAKDAWRGCAYKKLGGSVLYLEKAPRDIWNGATVARSVVSLDTTPTTVSEPESEAGSTLFIKNLSFNSTTISLTAAFSHLPAFVFARVQTKSDPKKPGQTLNMGFGFVGFRSIATAQSAMRTRQGFSLDGHQLEIKFAQRGKEDRTESNTKSAIKSKLSTTSTKLLVKNVPFEVTRKEIRELFSAHGQLKSVRLPRKLDQKTRGFAFLEFVSNREAQAAFSALEHTHLLGRHLVLQWAEEGDDNIEDLRAKAGLFSQKKIGARKEKFIIGDESGGFQDDGTETAL